MVVRCKFAARLFLQAKVDWFCYSSTRAAIDFPALFSSLVLVDPVVVPALEKDPSGGIVGLQRGAVARRSRWPSRYTTVSLRTPCRTNTEYDIFRPREEALESFRKTPFFQTWHPSVLETYVKEGIVSDPVNGGVKLKQSGFQVLSSPGGNPNVVPPADFLFLLQEACVFAERRVPVETWELLRTLNERVHLFWAMSGRRPVVCVYETMVVSGLE